MTNDPQSRQAKISALRQYIHANALGMCREAGGGLPRPFLAPGSEQYKDVLWDWDCWLSNVALRQIVRENPEACPTEKLEPAERGCILNYLHYTGIDGFMPIVMGRNHSGKKPEDVTATNMHKPCIAQHAAFLAQQQNDVSWLREGFYPIQNFLNHYRNHRRHACGLYFWTDDNAIGVDNDPCTFGRPAKSSGSIYLNCLMVRELEAAAWIADALNLEAIGDHYRQDRDALVAAIREHCWDEWTGFYYSVDLNIGGPEHLKPWPREWGHGWGNHYGQPCDWPCLIQRIGVWSGFLALWAGVATREQAERIVAEHYRNDRTFRCEAGIRTLSKLEKMFNVRASGNPSSWLGPVWGVSNYLAWRGLVDYGFDDDARELADKTIRLFARDHERFGALHEYYLPDNSEPVLNPGFMNWNFLVLNMLAWQEGREVVREFGAVPGRA